MSFNNQPLFASSAGGGQSDDFDLGEVFAEYFSNEFDLDPLNAYTTSMGNFSGTVQAGVPTIPATQAHAVATAQNKDAVADAGGATTTAPAATTLVNGVVPNALTVSAPAPAVLDGKEGGALPTGGIKTAFHVGSRPAPVGVIAPPQKKAKGEPESTLSEPQQPQQQQPAQVPAQATAPTVLMGGPVAALAMAHQQAASAAAVQQQQQQQMAVVAQQGGITGTPQVLQQQQQLANSLVAASQASAAAAAAGVGGANVPLPVGVGIRMGGMGGIAPATAVQAAAPVVPAQFAAAAMFGGLPGAASLVDLAAAGGGGAATEQAVAERRQRNREHAKRSRVRKKFMLESMQEQVRSLQIENQNLRLLVQEHIPEHAVSIISECCSSSPLFSESDLAESTTNNSNPDDPTKLGKTDFSLMESLTAGQRCFVLSDPKLPDNPIVFASPGFYEMTGYTAKETLGRNCRFLQGPGTDPRAVDVIRKAIATGADATICLLNYKADGTPFWNQFFIAALRDADNCIVNYVGVQCEVEPEQGDSAVEEKVNEVLPLAAKGDENEDQES